MERPIRHTEIQIAENKKYTRAVSGLQVHMPDALKDV